MPRIAAKQASLVEGRQAASGRAVAETYELVVRSRATLADGVIGLELVDPNEEPLPWWEPGAHVDVVTPEGAVRQYSLCGDYGVAKSWRIGILREPDGRGGSESIHLKTHVGDRLVVGVPRNNFPLLPAQQYLFIAGGIGITPLLSMVRAAQRRGASWHLVYAGRRRDSMAFVDELADIDPDNYTLMFEDEHGRPDLDALLAACKPATQVYCCGPSPMIAALEGASSRSPHVQLHVERFAATTDVADETMANEAFDVVLGDTGEVLHVDADETLLEALNRRGVSTVSSCLEGLCGTCEVGVLEGTPLHRDSLLTQEERDAGKWMMPCVSRCVGKRLTIDVTPP